MRELLGNSMYKLLGNTTDVSSWLCSNGGVPNKVTESTDDDDEQCKQQEKEEKARWRQKTRQSAALSKTGLWGPTHSFSSDDDSGFQEEKKFEIDVIETPRIKTSSVNAGSTGQPGTASTKSSHDSSPGNHQIKTDNNVNVKGPAPNSTKDAPVEAAAAAEPVSTTLGRVWNNLQCLEDRTLNNNPSPEDKAAIEMNNKSVEKKADNNNNFLDAIDEMCSPCRPKNLEDDFSEDDDDAPLGIARLAPPSNPCIQPFGSARRVSQSSLSKQHSTSSRQDAKSTTTVETAADRRRQRHERRQMDAAMMKNGIVVVGESSTAQEADQTEAYEVTQEDQIVAVAGKDSPVMTNRLIPLESLELNKQSAVELERSISGRFRL